MSDHVGDEGFIAGSVDAHLKAHSPIIELEIAWNETGVLTLIVTCSSPRLADKATVQQVFAIEIDKDLGREFRWKVLFSEQL
jgi:hypothetical protein